MPSFRTHPFHQGIGEDGDSTVGLAEHDAGEIAGNAPGAVRNALASINSGLAAPSVEAGLTNSLLLYDKQVRSDERHEGMRAFEEKRKPVFLS